MNDYNYRAVGEVVKVSGKLLLSEDNHKIADLSDLPWQEGLAVGTHNGLYRKVRAAGQHSTALWERLNPHDSAWVYE